MFDRRIGAQSYPVLQTAVKRWRLPGGIQKTAIHIELPAVITASYAFVLTAPKLKGCLAVWAALVDQP
jgi:hypothetical protein